MVIADAKLVSGPIQAFFAGGVAFNATAIVLAALGVALGCVALWVAIVQLRRIRTAADAAQQSAEGARKQVVAVAAVSSFSELCGLSRELLTLLRQENYEAALLRAQDLRGNLARARESLRGMGASAPRDWQDMITKVANVHNVLEGRRFATDEDRSSLTKSLHLVNDVHQRLNGLLSKVEAKAGDK